MKSDSSDANAKALREVLAVLIELRGYAAEHADTAPIDGQERFRHVLTLADKIIRKYVTAT